ncbi:phytoene/squalene synthase family protein [Streptomyces sp. DT171]|uniref:phytoene/squalene synthase family protein n=1 Tax=Streptomyces sp. DT171 TaxID=3416524 RepID=UPI003CEEB9B4
MTARELDAAGIHEPALRDAYTRCRRLNARHGKTYFLATRLLPDDRRPAVHALYGFARRADDIVDDLDSDATPAQRARALRDFQDRLEEALRRAPDPGPARRRLGQVTEAAAPASAAAGPDPVIRALVHTAGAYGIDHQHFADFMTSMRSDLQVTGYATYEELGHYMHGSAAVIGLEMLPVLGTVGPEAEAAPYAAALGVAFQLTNFLRDVGEDLDRGRLYLPADLLAAHGADRELLEWSRATGGRDSRITAALRAAAAHNRGAYLTVLPGLRLLDPVSRPCVRTAFVLYGGILDAIEDDGYAVLHRRAVVPRRRRAAVALHGLVRAVAARAAAPGRGRRAAPHHPDPARPAPAALRAATPLRKEPV